MWEYRATPLDTLDGDTVRLLVDLGFYARHQVDLRLLDVYAPELSEPGGTEARGFVVEWFAGLGSLRWPLLVRTQTTKVTEPTERQTFTRYIGEVWRIDQPAAPSLNDAIRQHLGSGGGG